MDDFDVKKAYNDRVGKYSLPGFKEINECFDLEKIEHEGDLFLKSVRKIMMDKILNCLNFFEMLMNPVNAPRLYLKGLSAFTPEDKKSLEKLYSAFGKLNLQCLKLDLHYNEKDEVAMIKDIFRVWRESEKDLRDILERLGTQSEENNKKQKNYFG